MDIISDTLKASYLNSLGNSQTDTLEDKSEQNITINLIENIDDKQENYKNYTKKELENMTLKQLQKLAKENKIKVKGKKVELIERFIEKKTLN